MCSGCQPSHTYTGLLMQTITHTSKGFKPSHVPLMSPLPARPSGAPLVTLASIPSKASQKDRQAARFSLQGAASRLMPRERVSLCLRKPIPHKDHKGVDLLYSPTASEAGRGSYGKLQRCGSVWLCPVCAAKISEKRRKELSQGTASWQGAGRRMLLVTFTLSHGIKDNLSDVLAALKYGRERVVSGRFAKDFKQQFKIAGTVRSLEVTYGDNGWHPHLHVLYFIDAPFVDIIGFEATLKAQWMAVLSSSGKYASWQHGVDVRFSDEHIAQYITKWKKESSWTAAHEITKGVSKMSKKGGYTPLQLLSMYNDLYGTDECKKWAALWIQYACNFKGQRQLFWSPGLRELLGLKIEKTDEELANEQVEHAILVATLDPRAWDLIRYNDMRGEVLDWLEQGPLYCIQQLQKYMPEEWIYVPPNIESILQ